MLAKGYPEDFAYRVFEQIKGFGGYGFPESHSASFAILCYFSSWLKCHHPAAFYCALLNSQPMGFYSPSQLIQDARRHQISVLPIDVNQSHYENVLENVATEHEHPIWGIRLGLLNIKGLDKDRALRICEHREKQHFESLNDFVVRTQLSEADLKKLANAEALHHLSGNRYQAHWAVAGIEENRPLFQTFQPEKEPLHTAGPNLEDDIKMDIKTTRVSLRPHIMALLRRERPFSQCKQQSHLSGMRSGCFVKVAGLVTGRQRPGTAKGTLFLTLEDETGNINVVVWKSLQERFRIPLLKGKLLLIKGTVETEGNVVHVMAGQVIDYSQRLHDLKTSSRDFH
jgi:error-prone DNA polymerase